MDDKIQIRALNDELRQRLTGGRALIAPGVTALGKEAVDRIIKTIAAFDDFCHASDPHEKHDFGAFEVDGQNLLLKIDYYDQHARCHSPDPAHPAVTSASAVSAAAAIRAGGIGDPWERKTVERR